MVLQRMRHGHIDTHEIHDPSESLAFCLEGAFFLADLWQGCLQLGRKPDDKTCKTLCPFVAMPWNSEGSRVSRKPSQTLRATRRMRRCMCTDSVQWWRPRGLRRGEANRGRHGSGLERIATMAERLSENIAGHSNNRLMHMHEFG
jgi:hypothetical protein